MGTEIFGRRARIRGQWEWGVVGGGTGFFHHRGTEDTVGTEIFMVGARGFEVGGNGALLGVVQGFFHHRGTEGTEIFYGKSAPIRAW